MQISSLYWDDHDKKNVCMYMAVGSVCPPNVPEVENIPI